jgi:hypothetical protein
MSGMIATLLEHAPVPDVSEIHLSEFTRPTLWRVA